MDKIPSSSDELARAYQQQRQMVANLGYRDGHWLTFDEILMDLASRLDNVGRAYLIAQADLDRLPLEHHGYGRWIRNSYGLWNGNPLTAKWMENPDGRTMIDGVDHSPDHPDAVSMRLIRSLVDKLLENPLWPSAASSPTTAP